MHRYTSCSICFGVFLLQLSLSTNGHATDLPGFVQKQPEQGPYVKTKDGYMVPYTVRIPGTGASFEMIPIPAGKCKIGSPDNEPGRAAVEGPRYEVETPPFWMAKHEVTWAEYKAFMSLYQVFKQFVAKNIRVVNDANRADAITAPTELYDPSFTFEYGENPRQPAVTMTQYAARQYSHWMTGITGQFYRLPSEAEWEYACRAGSDTAYYFGNDASQLGEYAWYYGNSDETTHPVGSKKPNAWGLYDMHGNVAEWVLDELLDDGYKRHAGRTLSAADAVVWPKRQYPRVAKGGSWDNDPEQLRCAARLGSHDVDWKAQDPNLPLSPWWYTDDPARGVGFRLMRPLVEPAKETRAKYWKEDVDEIERDVTNRLLEGRGVLGLVDRELPAAAKKLKDE